MQNLQADLPKGAWRNMVNGSGGDWGGPETLQFEAPAWSANDFFICLAVLTFSYLAISLG
jgi:hypothetical protein